jgi:hypothetical protein
MWDDQEWFDYMSKHNMPNPYEKEAAASLQDFFN